MEKTIQQILNDMTEEQQAAAYAMIDAAYSDSESMAQSGIDIDAETESIFRDARRNGSLKDSFLEHAEKYGVEKIEELFPQEKLMNNRPHFINNRSEWVNHILNNVHKLPFSRVKSLFSDISADTLHARGYTKTHKKVEDVISLLKRTTEPTTIYKKGKLDRDDILDITDFDVVAWIKEEMRMKLDEEIARTILIGDGRDVLDEFKIDEECIRPIYNDDDLFAVKVDIKDTDDSNRYKNIIASLVRSRKLYRGSGTPDLYTTDDVVAELLLLEDSSGKYIYKSEEELKSILRVKNIIIVNEMNGLTRTTADGTKKSVYGIITNIADYAIGTDKGGAVSMFDDFDIDYNQQKFLMETRCSGSLLKPYSALIIEGRDNGSRRPTVIGPSIFDDIIISPPPFTKSVTATLNSGSGGKNYFSTMFDLNRVSANYKTTSAKVDWVFTIKDTSSAKPSKIATLLIANGTHDRNNIQNAYNTGSVDAVTDVQYGKRYILSATYNAADGKSSAYSQLNAHRYIKPFIELTKNNTNDTNKTETHDVVIESVKITVNGKTYDITDTVSDFGTAEVSGSKSSVKVISKWETDQYQPYKGKIAGFLGNSITFGMDVNIGQTSIAMPNPWVKQLESLCGFSVCHNYGISSSTITSTVHNTSDSRNPMSIRYKTQMDQSSYDVIGVKASINDFWLKRNVGTPEDKETTTIYGAFDVLFRGLQEKFPNAKLFVMLPIDYWNDDGANASNPKLNINDSGVHLDEFRQAIREVAGRYDIPVLDLQSSIKFDVATSEGRLALIPDGLHPNQEGADKMASVIGTFINKYLK